MSGGRPRPSVEELRALLASSKPRDNLEAIEAAALMGEAAAPLVRPLTRLLTSEAYVSCDALEYGFSGHAILAEDAMRAIEAIGVAPDREELRRLLGDRRIIRMPEASYDQGAYIGDYGSTTFSPAGLAAQLAALDAGTAFALLDELAANAVSEADEIGDPARRALQRIAAFAAKAQLGERDAFAAVIDGLAALPEALAPTTSRGFALRDLGRHCRKLLGRA